MASLQCNICTLTSNIWVKFKKNGIAWVQDILTKTLKFFKGSVSLTNEKGNFWSDKIWLIIAFLRCYQSPIHSVYFRLFTTHYVLNDGVFEMVCIFTSTKHYITGEYFG